MSTTATYEIMIINSSGGYRGRRYCIYTEAPKISMENAPNAPVQMSRVICSVVGPLKNGARNSARFIDSYYGFIGAVLKSWTGTERVKVEMDKPAILGDGRNNGTVLEAGVKDGREIRPSTNHLHNAKSGSFVIDCRDPNVKEAYNEVTVVGLAQYFEDRLVPVACVPYRHGVRYIIKPSSSVYVTQAKESIEVEQVGTETVLKVGFPVEFQDSQSKVTITEHGGGEFSVDTGLGSYHSRPSRASAPQPQPAPRTIIPRLNDEDLLGLFGKAYGRQDSHNPGHFKLLIVLRQVFSVLFSSGSSDMRMSRIRASNAASVVPDFGVPDLAQPRSSGRGAATAPTTKDKRKQRGEEFCPRTGQQPLALGCSDCRWGSANFPPKGSRKMGMFGEPRANDRLLDQLVDHQNKITKIAIETRGPYAEKASIEKPLNIHWRLPHRFFVKSHLVMSKDVHEIDGGRGSLLNVYGCVLCDRRGLVENFRDEKSYTSHVQNFHQPDELNLEEDIELVGWDD